MRKLFDIVNPNFFSILSSPNKEIYVECLFKIYESIDSVDEDFLTEKTILIHKLVDFFDNYKKVIKEDDEVASTGREKANLVLKKLKDTGWIGEEELGDYKVSIHFFDYSLTMLETLEKICYGVGEDYSRDIFEIYATISAMETDNALDVLISTYEKTKSLISKLKNLRANIYRYYQDIITNKSERQLQETLVSLLEDYKSHFFDKAYFSLKTKDSLSRHKRTILKKIAQIADDDSKIDILANLALNENKKPNYNEAYFYVEEMIRFIEDSFAKLDLLMAQIDRKNEQYINAATKKILYLTTDGLDIKSLVNRFLRGVITDEITNDELQMLVNLVPIKNLDPDSLYTPRNYNPSASSQELIQYTDEEREWIITHSLNSIAYSMNFNFEKINDFAQHLLANITEIEAKDVSIINNNDYIKLILLFIYSKRENASYRCVPLEQYITNNFAYFQNFIIRRKK
ncbi:MAG: DUF5716 family protein [Acholeplasmatales bacterium]|jgi:hypothetical protein|nr:DUF5716 family protein [Acholeplasmatales bacterium]